jgi:hypothetical protein
MGIGSEGYVALRMGRRFVGCELKENYYKIALQNLSQISGDGYSFPGFQNRVGDWPTEDDGFRRLDRVAGRMTGSTVDPEQIDWITSLSQPVHGEDLLGGDY